MQNDCHSRVSVKYFVAQLFKYTPYCLWRIRRIPPHFIVEILEQVYLKVFNFSKREISERQIFVLFLDFAD